MFQRGANLPVYTRRSTPPGSRGASGSSGAGGTTGGNSTHLPHASATLPSRKQRSSSVWHSTYCEAPATPASQLTASGVISGMDCGMSVRYVHSRPRNASSATTLSTSRRPRSTAMSCRCAASTAVSTWEACAGVSPLGPIPSRRFSSAGRRMVTPGSPASGVSSRSVCTGAFSTSVTAHPARASASTMDCTQIADPSMRFRLTSPYTRAERDRAALASSAGGVGSGRGSASGPDMHNAFLVGSGRVAAGLVGTVHVAGGTGTGDSAGATANSRRPRRPQADRGGAPSRNSSVRATAGSSVSVKT